MKKIFCKKYLITLSVICYSFVSLPLFSQNKVILQGQVKQSDGSPLRNSAVLLYQYDIASKSFTLVDSTYTEADGKYKFEGSQKYFVLAKPDVSFPNELPTYYGNSLFSQKAASVSMTFGEPITADFSTLKKASLNGGGASLGGSINISGSVLSSPVSHLTVFLIDKDKNPVAVTSTNKAGDFSFKNLSFGDYQLWIDFAGVDNAGADIINLNSLNSSKEGLFFNITDGSLNWVDNSYTSIKDALLHKAKVYSLQLNSLQHDVSEKSLDNLPDGTKVLSAKIGEFSNLESLSLEINLISALPADIGKLNKLTKLSLSLNKLSALPAEIGNLKNLKSLNLGKNTFSKFPDVVSGLSSLEVLDFQGNPIVAIPPTINALKNLKELNLSGCFELLALPPQIGELVNLEYLDLSNCVKLKSLPKELKNLKNLKTLDISGTKLSAKDFQKAVPGCEVVETKK